jgi:hypothetical protein
MLADFVRTGVLADPEPSATFDHWAVRPDLLGPGAADGRGCPRNCRPMTVRRIN